MRCCSSLEGTINENKRTIKELENKIKETNLNTPIQISLNQENDYLKKEVERLNDHLNQLQENDTTNNSRINDLQIKLRSVEFDREKAKKDLSESKSEIEQLNERLANESSVNQNWYGELTKNNEMLKEKSKKISDQQLEIGNLKRDFQICLHEKERLINESAHQQSDIKDLNE